MDHSSVNGTVANDVQKQNQGIEEAVPNLMGL
jgi:hypothetical protein